MQPAASHFLNKRCGKDVTLLQKGQIISLHQAKKTTTGNAGTTKIGILIIAFFKPGRTAVNHHLQGRNLE